MRKTVAKLLRLRSRGSRQAYQTLKREWNKLPRPLRAKAKEQLI